MYFVFFLNPKRVWSLVLRCGLWGVSVGRLKCLPSSCNLVGPELKLPPTRQQYISAALSAFQLFLSTRVFGVSLCAYIVQRSAKYLRVLHTGFVGFSHYFSFFYPLSFSAALSFLKTGLLLHSPIHSCFLLDLNPLFVVNWGNSFRGKARWLWFLSCLIPVIQGSSLLYFLPAFSCSAVCYCLQRAVCVWGGVFLFFFLYLVSSLELLLAQGSVWQNNVNYQKLGVLADFDM